MPDWRAVPSIRGDPVRIAHSTGWYGARASIQQQTGELAIEHVPGIWHDIAAFDLQLHPFDFTADGPAVAAVTTQLRRRHATDSTYVCLGQRLGTTLWTLDGALARNAPGLGLPVELVA